MSGTVADTRSHARTLRSVGEMVDAGLVDGARALELAAVEAAYAIAISPAMAGLVDRADAEDPIARQFVPDAAELRRTPQEMADPIGDHAHSPVEGIVHRYRDRVLLKATPVCPVYCRFCFRREMVGPGKDAPLSADGLEAALDYIRAHDEIWEVIVTGGDPFMLSAGRVRALTQALDAIGHVKVIRWHTRMPVADPARVDDGFVDALRATDKPVHVVVHANHARELSAQARTAVARMADRGIVVLSQSVLLRGVNDTIGALGDLMRAFVESRIRPYYLHQMDFAPGTSHFRVPVEEGQRLVRELRDTLSGLCQPTYVIDIPGGVSKAVVAESDISATGDGVRLRGRDGAWRDYPGER